MFTTTKDTPMSYSHLSTTERFALYQYRTIINIFREVQLKFKPTQQFKGDKAFVGGQNISTPHKKPKKTE